MANTRAMETHFAGIEEPKEFLQREWVERRNRNPALSLRSFARFLKISPGRLSEILSGKRKLSLEMAERISERLSLEPDAKARLVSSILKGRRTGIRRPPVKRLDEADPHYQQLTIDAFHVISEWYHFAILNLRDCDDFKFSEKWIAARLDIGVGEVRLALVRLERLGLIKRKGKGWVRTHAHLTTTHDVRSAGLRKGHKGILERAVQSLDGVDVADRDITNMSMAIDPKKIPQAKAMLARFRKKFAKFLEEGKGRTEVYTVAIQFFPLTQLRKEKKL